MKFHKENLSVIFELLFMDRELCRYATVNRYMLSTLSIVNCLSIKADRELSFVFIFVSGIIGSRNP